MLFFKIINQFVGKPTVPRGLFASPTKASEVYRASQRRITNELINTCVLILVSLFSASCRNPLKDPQGGQKQNGRSSPLFALPNDKKLPVRSVFLNYESIRAALANDDFSRLGSMSDAISRELDSLEKGGNADSALLSGVRLALPGFKTGQASDLRSAFGKLSEPLVEAYKKSGSESLDLYHCPMASGYGYWLQPKGQSIANPYMGKRMVSCGTKIDLGVN